MVERRRKQINYLLENDPEAYKKVAEEFDLKSLEDRQEQARAEIEDQEEWFILFLIQLLHVLLSDLVVLYT